MNEKRCLAKEVFPESQLPELHGISFFKFKLAMDVDKCKGIVFSLMPNVFSLSPTCLADARTNYVNPILAATSIIVTRITQNDVDFDSKQFFYKS